MKKCMLLLAMFISAAVNAQTGFITNMGATQFKTALEADKKGKLIDVRQDWEFKKGHIVNAVNIDVMADDFDKQIALIPRDTPIYVYCYSGGRSTEAADKMKAMGFKKIVNLNGGVSAWEKALLPLVK